MKVIKLDGNERQKFREFIRGFVAEVRVASPRGGAGIRCGCRSRRPRKHRLRCRPISIMVGRFALRSNRAGRSGAARKVSRAAAL